MRPRLALALGLLALTSAVSAKEVVWRVTPSKKTKLVYEAGEKKFNWPWVRNDPNTISPFSAEEKKWMKAIFPQGVFRLLKNGDEGFPDEYLVLPDKQVLAKDDFFPVPAGGDGAQALVFVLRPPDGLVAADGKTELTRPAPPPPPPPTPPAEEASEPGIDLDALLYMENPPPPEEIARLRAEAAAKAAPPPPPPSASREAVDRTDVAGTVYTLFVKNAASGAAKVLFRGKPAGPLPGIDVHRIHSFELGRGRGIGVAFRWSGGEAGGFRVAYRLYARGPWGIEEAWRERVLDFPDDPVGRRATRFYFADMDGVEGAASEPELFVRRVNLSVQRDAPAIDDFLPQAGGKPVDEDGQGVVDIYQLRGGKYKLAGRADRAKGDRPVTLRKNWPDYVARSSRGPTMLLSFGNPGSPYEAYPCPWPGHPATKVPWVSGGYVFKGGAFRKGAGDVGLATWFLHDPQALYLVAVMKDDKLVSPGIEGDPALGDHLQLWLDPQYGSESLMLELFPGSPPGAGAFARVRSPSSKAGPATRVRVAARPLEGGFWLEAAIPYSYLTEMGMRPTGSLWGVAVNAVDVDSAAAPDKKTVVSTTKVFGWAKTATFNNLILE